MGAGMAQVLKPITIEIPPEVISHGLSRAIYVYLGTRDENKALQVLKNTILDYISRRLPEPFRTSEVISSLRTQIDEFARKFREVFTRFEKTLEDIMKNPALTTALRLLILYRLAKRLKDPELFKAFGDTNVEKQWDSMIDQAVEALAQLTYFPNAVPITILPTRVVFGQRVSPGKEIV